MIRCVVNTVGVLMRNYYFFFFYKSPFSLFVIWQSQFWLCTVQIFCSWSIYRLVRVVHSLLYPGGRFSVRVSTLLFRLLVNLNTIPPSRFTRRRDYFRCISFALENYCRIQTDTYVRLNPCIMYWIYIIIHHHFSSFTVGVYGLSNLGRSWAGQDVVTLWCKWIIL